MNKYLLTLGLIITFFTSSLAQQNESIKIRKSEKESHIAFQIKDGTKPDVYIDGKKYDADIIELLDQSQIASMDVIKGDKALEKYNAPNGVILITSKKKEANQNITAGNDEQDGVVTFKNKANEKVKPLLIVDGKEWDHDSLKKLDPQEIEKIEVVKGDDAVKKYNAPNGVIIVTTKNKKKNKK